MLKTCHSTILRLNCMSETMFSPEHKDAKANMQCALLFQTLQLYFFSWGKLYFCLRHGKGNCMPYWSLQKVFSYPLLFSVNSLLLQLHFPAKWSRGQKLKQVCIIIPKWTLYMLNTLLRHILNKNLRHADSCLGQSHIRPTKPSDNIPQNKLYHIS
jgi:hypothetical protein